MKDFISFLSNPYDLSGKEDNYYGIYIFVKSIFLLIFLLSIVGVIKMAYSYLNPHNGFQIISEQYHNIFEELIKKKGRLIIYFVICVMMPIIEELSFRLGFSFKKNHVLINIICAIAFSVLSFSANINLLFIALIVCCTIIPLYLKFLDQEKLNIIKNKYGILILHIVAVSFALLHLNNFYPLNISYAIEYLLLIIPILISSYILSFIRIRSGFMYGVALHVIFNSITFIVSFIS